MSPPPGLESSPDDLLVRRIGQGDDLALATIYDRYAPMILSVTRAITRSEPDAEEVAESVFLYLWKTPDRFDPARGSLRTYLGTIARSRARDRVRASRRRTDAVRRSAVAGGGEFASPVSAPGGNPEEEVLKTETRDQLRGLLGDLTEEQRTAIELAFLGGLTQSEIARELGVPLGTVKTRIRDGMGKLREMVKAGGFAR